MQTNQQPFSHKRTTPVFVLVSEAKFNYVQVGGNGLCDLREDFFDNAANSANRTKTQIVSAYDIALSGGEPYAKWI